MKRYRVVCSTDSAKQNKNTIIDFAAADLHNARLSHDYIFKLRQFETPNAKQILPPTNILDSGADISIGFDKPEATSLADKELLNEMTPRIRLEFQKFKQRGIESTVQITPENIIKLYENIDYHQPPQSAKEAQLFEELQRAEDIQRRKADATQNTIKRMTLEERLLRYSGD